MPDAILKNEKSPLKIQLTDHFDNEVRILGIPSLLKQVEELLAAQGEPVILDGVDREMRRQIGELRPTRWIRMRANHDGYRW